MPQSMALEDAERFPSLAPEALAPLQALRQHPRAPRWTFACGDRLRPAHHEALNRWARSLRTGEPEEPLDDFVARVLREVPFYRDRAAPGTPLTEIPSFRRAELVRAPWALVPDPEPLADLLVFHTSGTTGPPFPVYSHPIVANAPLPFLQEALARLGLRMEGGPGRVSLACVHHQLGTYTYPSLMSWLGGAAYVKLNLHPTQWRDPADIVPFLDELDPEVWTGDPYALAQLAALPLRTRPKALVSSATALSGGARRALEARFGCPVLDLYSLTEARMVAADWGEGHRVLAPDWHVEILAPNADIPLGPGERGELTLTGGQNPLLPLVRYRTGDFARFDPATRTIVELEGRAPVCLLSTAGEVVNTIDVSRALSPFALPRFQLEQHGDGALTLRVDTGSPEALNAALEPLFGRPVAVGSFAGEDGGKKVQFVGALPWPSGPAAVLGAGA